MTKTKDSETTRTLFQVAKRLVCQHWLYSSCLVASLAYGATQGGLKGALTMGAITTLIAVYPRLVKSVLRTQHLRNAYVEAEDAFSFCSMDSHFDEAFQAQARAARFAAFKDYPLTDNQGVPTGKTTNFIRENVDAIRMGRANDILLYPEKITAFMAKRLTEKNPEGDAFRATLHRPPHGPRPQAQNKTPSPGEA